MFHDACRVVVLLVRHAGRLLTVVTGRVVHRGRSVAVVLLRLCQLLLLLLVVLLRMKVRRRMLVQSRMLQVLQWMLLMQLKMLLLLLLVLANVSIHFGVLAWRVDGRRKGGIQFPLLLFELPQQFGVLPLGSFVLVVLVVVGVGRRRRVGHVGLLGRGRRVNRVRSTASSSTSGRRPSCLSTGTGNQGRLVDVRSSGTRSCLVAGRQRVEVLRCRTINKMSMQMVLDTALAELLVLGGEDDVPQRPVLVHDLLHDVAGRNLHRHRHRRSTVL